MTADGSGQRDSSTLKRKRTKKSRSKSLTSSDNNGNNKVNSSDSTTALFSLQGIKKLDLRTEEMEQAMANHDDNNHNNNKKRKVEDQNPEPEQNEFNGGDEFIALAPSSDEEEEEDQDKPEHSSTELPSVQRTRRRRSRSPSPQYLDRYSDRQLPWCEGLRLSSCRNAAELLHNEVLAFTQYMSPTSHEDSIRTMIVDLVERAVTSYFPDAKILPFGSFSTKLYLPSGDIDLVACSDSMASANKHDVLQRLAAALKDFGITHRVQIIAKAKVPIVKFVTRSELGCFQVDVSVNQINGLEALRIVKAFLGENESQPEGGLAMGVALRALVLVTKQFLAQRSMNEVFTGGLGSYSIVCLAISFLQMHPRIRNGDIDPSKNLGVLLIGFFELYGVYFNHEQVGISLRDGGRYFNKRRRGWHDYYNSRRLCIEDPADDTNDISSGSYAYHKVRTSLTGAHSLLTSNSYMKAGILKSRKTGEYHDLRGRGRGPSNTELSILSSIVSIKQDTVNQRRLVEEIWHSGNVHRMCGLPFPPLPPPQPREKPPPLPKVSLPPKQREQPPAPPSKRNRTETGKRKGKEVVEFLPNGDTRVVLDLVSDCDDESPAVTAATAQRPKHDEEKEEGRYDMARKKRKVGPSSSRVNTRDTKKEVVFISVSSSSSSSSDDEEGEVDEGSEGLLLNIVEEGKKDILPAPPVEEGEVAKIDVKKTKEEKEEKGSRRRDYWLSKGMGGGADMELSD